MSSTGGVALASGGGTGIGLAVVRALLDRGWSVSICGRDQARLDQAVAELGDERLEAVTCDVTVEEDVVRWVGTAVDRFGPPRLLVNNAGVVVEATIAETAICPDMVATGVAVGTDGIGPDDMLQAEDVARSVLYLLELSPGAAVPELVLKGVGAA